MNFDHLQEQIKGRFWRCNELTEKQADDYAWIAVNQMQRHMTDMLGAQVIIPMPNQAMQGFSVRQASMEAVK